MGATEMLLSFGRSFRNHPNFQSGVGQRIGTFVVDEILRYRLNAGWPHATEKQREGHLNATRIRDPLRRDPKDSKGPACAPKWKVEAILRESVDTPRPMY